MAEVARDARGLRMGLPLLHTFRSQYYSLRMQVTVVRHFQGVEPDLLVPQDVSGLKECPGIRKTPKRTYGLAGSRLWGPLRLRHNLTQRRGDAAEHM